MIPTSAERVAAHTSHDVNREIQDRMAESVRWHANHPEAIGRRLRELDQEWDIERTLEANAASLMFAGVALGAGVDKRWLALPAFVSAFLLQHAVQGWCPPLPVLRRLGFRTVREIDEERFALKALRGDFLEAKSRSRNADDRPRKALSAARL
jgi:hypothetical protein